MAMSKTKPRLPFAITDLLPPVGDESRAMVVPHQRRRCKGNPSSTVLKSPAHVDVIAGAKEDGVEAADRQQRLAARGKVATRNVLRLAVVEHHVAGRAWRTRNAL